jgi:hypothetical protein
MSKDDANVKSFLFAALCWIIAFTAAMNMMKAIPKVFVNISMGWSQLVNKNQPYTTDSRIQHRRNTAGVLGAIPLDCGEKWAYSPLASFGGRRGEKIGRGTVTTDWMPRFSTQHERQGSGGTNLLTPDLQGHPPALAWL